MPTSIELTSKFKQILSENLDSAIQSGEPEVVFTLCKTDWVRILLVRQIEVTTSLAIDVEVSLPSRSSSYNTSPISGLRTIEDTSRKLLETMMKHIQYVLDLETSGFSVDIVSDGCLLIAYKNFDQIPDTEILQLLQPPSE